PQPVAGEEERVQEQRPVPAAGRRADAYGLDNDDAPSLPQALRQLAVGLQAELWIPAADAEERVSPNGEVGAPEVGSGGVAAVDPVDPWNEELGQDAALPVGALELDV